MIGKFFDLFARNVRSIIAMIVVVGGFAFLFTLTQVKIPDGNETVLNVASGLVLAAMTGVIAYYFGSSKDKSDTDKSDALIEQKKAGM